MAKESGTRNREAASSVRQPHAEYNGVTVSHHTQKLTQSELQAETFRPETKGFPGSGVKNLPVEAGDTASTPGPGRLHMPWSS